MSRLNLTLSSFITRLCAVMVSLLGFGCSSSSDEPDILVMYGTPMATFEIKGKVTDTDGAPVSRAVMRVSHPDVDSDRMPYVSASPDVDGRYLLEGDIPYMERIKVVCVPGDEGLGADSVIITPQYVRGHAVLEADFKLEKKKDGE